MSPAADVASEEGRAPAAAPEPHDHGGELRRRAVRGGAILMGTRLGVQVMTWSLTIVVARILKPFDYGVLTTGSIFLGLADILAEAGLGRAIVQRRELAPGDVAEGFTLSLALSVSLYAALFALAPGIAAFLDNPVLVTYLRVASLLLLLVPFRTVPMALLERQLRMGRQSAVFLLSATAQSLVVLALALLGWGYWSLVAGTFTGRVLEAAALSRITGWAPRLGRLRPADSSLLRFGAHISGTSLLWYFYSNADFAIIGKVCGPTALGYYSFAFTLITIPVQRLTSNFNQVAYPVFCRLQGDPGRLRGWYLRLSTLLGLVGLPVMVGMALVARDAVGVLLGPKWLPAILPFQIMSVAGMVMVISYSLSPVFVALGRPDVGFKYMLVSAVLFPTCFYLGARSRGVLGVCAVWMLVYPVVVAASVTLTRHITGFGLVDLLRAQRPVLAATAFMVVAVLALQGCCRGDAVGGLRLVASIATGVAAYAGFLWLTARRTVLADLRLLWRELRG